MKRSLTFALLLLSGLALFSCNKRIDAGCEGIRVKQYGSDKGVQDVTLVTGRAFYNPFTEDIEVIPLFQQTADYDAFTVNAKDGSVFTVDPTIAFRVQAGKSPLIYTKYRKSLDDIKQTTLLNYVKDAYRIQVNKYTTDELITNLARFEATVQKTLDSTLRVDGFRLDGLTSALVYPEPIQKAINLKNKVIQDAITEENNLRVAKAKAETKIIEAEAEAKANALKERTLSSLLIQQKFIEKWNGTTPLYGNAPTFFKNVQ